MPERSNALLLHPRQKRFGDWLCIGILAAAFALFARLSWRTWPDILVDFGQELYVPWRLAEGDVLYRDVAWVTGPLPQYANSLLFRFFGVSLTTLIFANLTLLAVIVAMLYSIFRRCGTLASATFTVLFFLAVFAFGQYSLIGNYNYVCPYRHDMTHGVALGLMNLLSLARFGRTRQTGWLALSGLSLGMLSLIKVEMVLAACLTTAVALPLFICQMATLVWDRGESASRNIRSLLMPRIGEIATWCGIVAGTALVPIGIAVAALAGPLGWMGSCRQIFLQYWLILSPELSSGSGFYRAITGTDHLLDNLIAMALTTVVVLLAGVAGCVGEMTVGSSNRANAWATVLGVAAGVCGLIFIPLTGWQAIPACLPVLLALTILLNLRPVLRDADGSTTMFFLAAIYGIGLLPKILLRVGWSHYGFVLAMPGTLVLIHAAVHSIPAWWKSRRRSGRCFQAIAAGLLVACAFAVTWSWIRIDLSKTVVVGDRGDRFYGEPRYDGRTLPTVKTLIYLRRNMLAGESLMVFPNGVMLNYLLRKPNPTPYIMFNPWESLVHGGEDRIADQIISAAPDYAVVVSMDLTIHGRGNFGSPEFGGRIRKFLDEYYDVVNEETSTWGMEGEFIATVLKRRSTGQ